MTEQKTSEQTLREALTSIAYVPDDLINAKYGKDGYIKLAQEALAESARLPTAEHENGILRAELQKAQNAKPEIDFEKFDKWVDEEQKYEALLDSKVWSAYEDTRNKVHELIKIKEVKHD